MTQKEKRYESTPHKTQQALESNFPDAGWTVFPDAGWTAALYFFHDVWYNT